ncbi:Glycosyltransferase Family 1 protein [Glomus cerebriforme]|uniref:Glycosyltransferase Family 1 protein n=1 Tax=Glomus cerebriforme TaxID=658196 RepID=A0A397SYE8_9GLOM|nr:Glycosyltransferase Family 1 protein [Glomus cerebriforme]
MIKNHFTLLLSILLLLYVNTATIASQDYIRRNADLDLSPKNILIGSYIGGRSHVKPMLDIAAILIERGHNVILVTSGNYTPASEYPTVKQVSLGPTIDYNDMGGVTSSQKQFDYTAIKAFEGQILKSYSNNFEKFKNAAKEYNIDLFFCHALVNDACLDAAYVLKKPLVGFSSYAQMVAPATYKSDPILHCNTSLENASFFERFRCTIIQPIKMVFTMYPFANQLNNMRKQFNVESSSVGTGDLRRISLYLLDTFFGFELPQSLPPNIQEIGPVLPREYPPLTPELSDFINAHKRVLYVAFGARFTTTVENNSKLMQSFVEAINKNMIDGVVWALSQTSKDAFYPTLNPTDGSQIQTSSILNNEHPHIRIVKFAPQFAVLNHPNTKLFLSHGGAGSVHESLYTGTPMLVLPLGSDQMGNAEKLESAGVALSLNKMKLDVNDIINKMDILLKDENVKKNAKRMEALAKIDSKRKYRAADSIEYILYSSSLNEGISEGYLNEWAPADSRMGFIRGNNLDVYGAILVTILGLVGGILWGIFKLIRFIVKRNPSSDDQKSKRE